MYSFENSSPKVLITDDVSPILIEGFEKAGYSCHYSPQISYSEVLAIVHDYEGLIINTKITAYKELLDKAVKLKFIGRLGSGMEIIDQVYAAQKNIAVYSAPEGNANAVAEHAVGLLLALANKIAIADAEVRQMVWQREKNRGWELKGKTLSIIGYGHTGSAFAKCLMGFDMNILVYDKYKTNYVPKPYQSFIFESSWEEIFEKADILSLHLPLTPEVKHLVQDSFLKKFKKNIIIINTSRGMVIDTKALLRALVSGKVAGAALDVYENEKINSFSAEEKKMYQELYAMKNTILTPHIAGWTHESKRLIAQVLLEKIIPK